MHKKFIVATMLAIVAFPVWAEVIIQSAEDVVVVAIDDQEIRSNLLQGNQNSYKVDAGQHSISVRYRQIFNHLSGDHDVLKSNVVTLNQVELREGQSYQLSWVDAPEEFELAKTYVLSPTIALKNTAGQVVAQQAGISSKAKPWFSNGLFSAVTDLTTEKKAEPKTSATSQASVNTQAVPSSQVRNSTQTGLKENAQIGKDQQLIELWQSASTQERQKFAAWLAEQAAK